MIITKNFVLLNYPKTGSSFVRKVLKELYKRKLQSSLYYRAKRRMGFLKPFYRELKSDHILIKGYQDQHGGCFQIPEDDKSKAIVSVIRNPYDRFDSQYRYEWWKKNPRIKNEILISELPNFPDLTISEYLVYRRLLSEKLRKHLGIPIGLELGVQTITFLHMFLKDPISFYKTLGSSVPEPDDIIKLLCNVQFLRQEQLNKDLIGFLLGVGFRKSEIEFISEFEKVNVTEKKKDEKIDTQIIDYVDTYDKLLIEILQSMSVEY